jgi:hypothetical protein
MCWPWIAALGEVGTRHDFIPRALTMSDQAGAQRGLIPFATAFDPGGGACMLWEILWGVSINLSLVQYRSHNNPKGRKRYTARV